MAQDAAHRSPSPVATPTRGGQSPEINPYAAALHDDGGGHNDSDVDETPSRPTGNDLNDVDLKDISLDDSPDVSPTKGASSPSRKTHARIESSASAASAFSLASDVSAASGVSAASRASKASGVSTVSFEEVGFDDGPGWTDAPGHNLPPLARIGELSSASVHSSPMSARSVRSDATMTPSKGGITKGLGLRIPGDGEVPLVLGVAVVDFNHLIGPTVEFAHPASLADALANDDELARLLPFLALPDGAHLSEEDYSYFHCSYNPGPDAVATDVPGHRTLFGISCNRQIAAVDLIKRGSDVTRSMVQKAVVVLASQPVFGPVRDRLGVVTRAYFAQRDFGSTQILHDFYESLELGLEGKAGENAIYMGTSLRELVHKFRYRTLILLKMLLLQKRVMLFGYPVEMLCTYQYSLVSLIPGLLMNLRDSGSPMLDSRVQRARPTSLKTSDRASLLRYMGLPLHLFGAGAAFQPYLPLQQMDMLQAPSWLVGTTNQIVTQQRDCKYDLLVNIDTNTFEFADPKVERLVSLTPADRAWMDELVKTVEDTWNLDEGERADFQGSDDDLRNRFEEYLCAFLSSIKYSDFIKRSAKPQPEAAGQPAEQNPLSHFSEAFTASFRSTPAYDAWQSCTDDTIFDLCEPRHPMEGKVNAVSDIGIRLAEGLHDLRLDEQLAPTREALSSAFATGSASLFRAFDGVRSEVNARLEAERQRRAAAAAAGAPPVPPKELELRDVSSRRASTASGMSTSSTSSLQKANATTPPATQPTDVRATLGSLGASVGSFFSSRVSTARPQPERRSSGLRPMSLVGGRASPQKKA